MARKYLTMDAYREEWGTLSRATDALKWSPCDSPYHVEFAHRFDAANELLQAIWNSVDPDSSHEFRSACEEIDETFLAVLREVRDSGIFRRNVVFNLLIGDQSNEEQLYYAERLNFPEVAARFRAEIDYDEDVYRRIAKTDDTA